MAKTILIFDTSPLFHFARADELETLQKLVEDFTCVTTKAVIGELKRGAQRYPTTGSAIGVDWIKVVSCDDLEVLYLFGKYMNRLGNLERNAGEASVLAWAEHHSATAYVDDQVACNVGRGRGVTVHRTLHLVINAVRTGIMTEGQAQALIKRLADTDARFPKTARTDLFAWARSQNPPLI